MTTFMIEFGFEAVDEADAEDFRQRLEEHAVDLAEELEISMDNLELSELV